jgi:hypothetical protein
VIDSVGRFPPRAQPMPTPLHPAALSGDPACLDRAPLSHSVRPQRRSLATPSQCLFLTRFRTYLFPFPALLNLQ